MRKNNEEKNIYNSRGINRNNFFTAINNFCSGHGKCIYSKLLYIILYRDKRQVTIPTLSYNDNTYIAIRDVGEMVDKDVEWYEEYQEIRFVKKDLSEGIVKEQETALAIGKAIAAEYYPDRVDENTEYLATYTQITSISVNDIWCVFIRFNDEKVVHNEEEMVTGMDVRIDINPMTCNFRILERNIDGEIVEVLEFKNAIY